MNCPYCGEEIDEHTSHCRLCGADLTLIQPLLASIQHLTRRIEALEGSGAQGAAVPSQPARPVEPPSRPALQIPNISDEIAVILGLLGIAAAHFAVVGLFDARLVYLLVASIVIPFTVGFLRRGPQGHSLLRVIGSALLLAFAALAEMSYVTWALWRVPLIPQNLADWREIVDYGSSIALSFIAGALVRGLVRFWYIGRGRIHIRKPGFVRLVLKSFGIFNPEALETVDKMIKRIEITIVELGALAGSVFYLIDHVRPILAWLQGIKPG